MSASEANQSYSSVCVYECAGTNGDVTLCPGGVCNGWVSNRIVINGAPKISLVGTSTAECTTACQNYVEQGEATLCSGGVCNNWQAGHVAVWWSDTNFPFPSPADRTECQTACESAGATACSWHPANGCTYATSPGQQIADNQAVSACSFNGTECTRYGGSGATLFDSTTLTACGRDGATGMCNVYSGGTPSITPGELAQEATTCAAGSCNSWQTDVAVTNYDVKGSLHSVFILDKSTCQGFCETTSGISATLCAGGVCNSWQANHRLVFPQLTTQSPPNAAVASQAECQTFCEAPPTGSATLCAGGVCNNWQANTLVNDYTTEARDFGAFDQSSCGTACESAGATACMWDGAAFSCSMYTGPATLSSANNAAACELDGSTCYKATTSLNPQLLSLPATACGWKSADSTCMLYSGAVTIGAAGGGGGGGCADPVGVAGDLVFNATHNVLQYCDGDTWMAVGK